MRAGAARVGPGLEIAFETDGDGPPLLLVSGQSDDRHAWDRLVPRLRDRFTTIVYDHEGTGLSRGRTPGGMSTRGFARQAIGVLDELGVQRAHVFGISMGGRVAQSLAVLFPDRLLGVVIGASSPGGRHGIPRDPAVSAAIGGASGDAEERVRFDVALQVSEAWAAANPDYVESRRRRFARLPAAEVMAAHFRASEEHDEWDGLPSVSAPVLVVHGSDDVVNVVGNGVLLAGRIPGARLVEIAGGRHGFFEEFADETVELLAGFALGAG